MIAATADPAQLLEFLKKAHDEFQPLSAKMVFDKSHPLHRNVVALYGSILELTGSSIILIDRKLIAGVPILLRAILEAYIDLVNLVSNAQYGYHLEAAYLKEWLKLLVEAQGGKNEYLRELSESPNLSDQITRWREEQRKLKIKGYHTLSIEDKFRKAGMEKAYRSLYNSLCCDAHNNLRALINRHIERDAGDFSMVFYKDYSPDDSAVYVGTNAEILVRASQVIHEFLNSPVQAEVARYRAEFDALRGDS